MRGFLVGGEWWRAPPQALPFGFTFTDFSQHNMFPRARRDRWGGTWKLKSFVNPGKTLKFREEPYELVSRRRDADGSTTNGRFIQGS